MQRIENMKQKGNILSGYKKDKDGKLVLEEGTLLHGTGTVFDHEEFLTDTQIKSISENGIMSSEVIGGIEFGETHFCADFFRVEETQTMEKYIETHRKQKFKIGDERYITADAPERSYLPILSYTKENIAFIINNNGDSELQEILEYDVYRSDSKHQEKMKEIVNFENIQGYNQFDIKERFAAVLGGIPAECFSGILISDDIKQNDKIMQQLQEYFPDCYIANRDGEFVVEPHPELAKTIIDIPKHTKLEGLQIEKYVNKDKIVNKKLSKSYEISTQNIGKGTIESPTKLKMEVAKQKGNIIEKDMEIENGDEKI